MFTFTHFFLFNFHCLTYSAMGNLPKEELNASGFDFFEQLCFKVEQVVECKFDLFM